uniref:Protein tyrosine phosphatase receptor type N n=1 Tax=Sphenodon punctatus TaxID=8508 RepID=A0A8D0HQ46_SPHPU
CSQQEVCIQDGLFGQCQESAGRDGPYFQVTALVLQRLQDVLRRLMAQGLSWQDDLTQYVISQEMERIPRLRPQDPGGAKDRFSQVRPAPRRPPFSVPEPALGQHPAPDRAQLPPALLQQYLELLLPSKPELGYEAALLPSYPYYKVSPPSRSPQSPALLGRASASRALFRASPLPSYRGQLGLDGGQLFQDLGALYLAQGKPGRTGTRAQQDQDFRATKPPRDYGDGYQEAKPVSSPPADPALQRLAAVLASYGLGPQDLSRQQLSEPKGAWDSGTVPAAGGDVSLLRQVTEGEMQHGDEPEPPPSSTPTAGPKQGEVTSPAGGQAGGTADSPVPAAAQDPAGPGGVLRPEGQQVLVKKNPQVAAAAAAARGGDGEQPEAMRVAEEYGYILTDQKPPLALGAPLSLRHGSNLIGGEGGCQGSAPSIPFGGSVVGPALTFRIRQNHQNLSLADVANRAALVKPQLEAELGVKIVQTGVGQVSPPREPLQWHRGLRGWQGGSLSSRPECPPTPHAGAALAPGACWELRARPSPLGKGLPGVQPLLPLQIDHDPRMPAYIATQGPLSHTIADFWQVRRCRVPGVRVRESESMHSVNLVSEHIWCEDFLVRSFYLKNVQSQETRTLTQFHFLSWPAEGIPATTRPLLDFRSSPCREGQSKGQPWGWGGRGRQGLGQILVTLVLWPSQGLGDGIGGGGGSKAWQWGDPEAAPPGEKTLG